MPRTYNDQIRNIANPSADSRAIVMSGAPGSGKSTLARLLADKLRFIHIERDTILETYCQQNKDNKRYTKQAGIPRYFELLEHLIDDGQDLVIDGTLYAGKSEDDMPRVCRNARAINIHTEADQTIDRFVEREKQRNNGTVPDWVREHKTHLEKIYPETAVPLDLKMPSLTVSANEEYAPELARVVLWARKQFELLANTT